MNRGPIRLPELSIGQRLGWGFGGLLLVLAALLGLVLRWQGESLQAQRELTQQIRPLAAASAGLERHVLQAALELRAYLLQPDAARRERYEQAAAAARVAALQLQALPMDAAGKALFAQLLPALERYLSAADALVARDRSGAPDRADELQLLGLRAVLVDMAARQAQLPDTRTSEALQRMERASRRIVYCMAAGAALTVAVLSGLAWFTVQAVRRPARALLGVTVALRDGRWKDAQAQVEAMTRAAPGAHSADELMRIGHALGAAAAALEHREGRLAAERRVAAAAASDMARADMARPALRAVVEHVGAEVGVLYAATPAQGLEPVCTWGRVGREDMLGALAPGEGLPGQAARRRDSIVVHDLPPDTPWRIHLGHDTAPPRSVAAVPIPGRESVLGVLLVASLRMLDHDAQLFLQAAACQLGIGLSNAYAYEEIQRLLAQVEERNRHIQAQNEALQAQYEESRARNDALAQQAARVRQQADQLAQADRRKSEFLGLLAHELRNPMAGISNSLALLSLPSASSLHLQKAQAIMARQTHQLSRLIDDLLDVTRISQGRIALRREPVDLARLLHECIEDQHAAVQAAGLTLRTACPDGPVFVEADRVRLSQIMAHLLDNAIKFSDRGADIELSLAVDAAHGQARLAVRDHGAGIDPALMEQLFEPFVLGDPSPSRHTGGLGLGLHLVRHLVELHGGAVRARSDGLGQGACFEVELPLREPAETVAASAAEAAAPAPAWPAGPARPARILIVEDNIDAADSLAAAVEAEGYEVRIANSAADGLQVAASFKPDILLCDIGLPVMDGYEVARRLRADDELRSVYLVAVTGYAGQHDIEQATQAGFDMHMAKPPDLQRLSVLLADVAIERAKHAAGTGSPPGGAAQRHGDAV